MVLVPVPHSHAKRRQAADPEQIVDVPVLWFMEEIVEIVAGEIVWNARAIDQATGDSTGGRAHFCRGDNTAEQTGRACCPTVSPTREV